MKQHKAFPKIRGMAQVYREMQINGEFPIAPMRAKIKLHGTNAAVRITPDGEVTAQKRREDADMTALNGHFGFVSYVKANNTYYSSLSSADGATLVIYGEWAGPGVQANVALSQIEDKQFFVFAIRVIAENGVTDWFVEPDDIRLWLHSYVTLMPKRQHVVPWFKHDDLPPVLDYRFGENVKAYADAANAVVARIDAVDPYVAEKFGVEGHGEGLVFYPHVTDRPLDTFLMETYMFKVKGGSHQKGSGGEKKARIKEPPTGGEVEFCKRECHDARMMQGVEFLVEVGKPVDITSMGSIIGWVCKDISQECSGQIEDEGISTKRIGGIIANHVREWYLRYLDDAAFDPICNASSGVQ